MSQMKYWREELIGIPAAHQQGAFGVITATPFRSSLHTRPPMVFVQGRAVLFCQKPPTAQLNLMKYPQNFSISLRIPAEIRQRGALIFFPAAGSGVPLLPGERRERCQGVGMMLRG